MTDSALPSGLEWLELFARELGCDAPTAEEVEDLLNLAGVAAHSSERLAAPLACYLVGRTGLAPADALAVAERLSGGLS